MGKCANENCNQESTRRYCDSCYKAHQAKLSSVCKSCSKKIMAGQEYCSYCERKLTHRALCKKCGVTCRKGAMFCTDCRNTQDTSTFEGSSNLVFDQKCEQCGADASSKYCNSCRDSFKKTTRPCAECHEKQTFGTYCEECIARYKATQPVAVENKCQDCGYRIAQGRRYCPVCIAAFKAKSLEMQKPCRTTDCTNQTTQIYCESCTRAYKASKKTL